jgi:peptidoglycan/LPS O-acetylase OafA/YrhL
MTAGNADAALKAPRPAARRLGYQPALDGIRAFAVMAVITHHALLAQDWPPSGDLGVTTFFVSSGFLITVLLLQENADRGSVSLTRFYRRRGLRLLPALSVFLAAFLAYSFLQSLSYHPNNWSELKDGSLGALAGLFYFTNVLLGYDVGFEVPITIGHLWTLATQEQFYLLWPPVLALALRRRVSAKWIAVGLLAAIVALATHRFLLAFGGAHYTRVKFAPDVTFDSILLGCLAGVAFVNGWIPVRDPRKIGVAGFLAAVACLAMIVTPASDEALYGLFVPGYSIAALIVMLAAITSSTSLVNRGLSARPVVFVGRISYSLFLWQQLFIFAIAPRVTMPVAIALAFATSYASYVLVEQRFLAIKRRDRAQLEDQAAGLESSAVAEPPEAPTPRVAAAVQPSGDR